MYMHCCLFWCSNIKTHAFVVCISAGKVGNRETLFRLTLLKLGMHERGPPCMCRAHDVSVA